MITCSECSEQLSAYMDRMLDENEIEEIKAHLLSCEACAEALEKLQTNARLMCELSVDPPAEFCSEWRASVRSEAQKAKRKWMTMRQIGLVAAALVVAVTAWRVWPAINGSQFNSPVKMESGVEAPEMAADQAPSASLKMAAGTVPDSANAESAPAPEAAPVPAAEAPTEGMEQAQIMMTEAPAAPDSAAQDSVAEEPDSQRNAGSSGASPSAADNASQSPMSLAGAPENLYAADAADMPLGIISFTFTSVDSAAAHAIVMDALSRMAIKGVVQDGVIAVPPMTEQLRDILYEHVRAVCIERNVSEAVIASTQNNVPPAATQIVVVSK